MIRRQQFSLSRTFGAVVLIGVLCGWEVVLSAPDSMPVASSTAIQTAAEAVDKPFVWSFPETFDSGVPIKSNIIRLSFPGSANKNADYVGCAQTLARHVQREFGAGVPALIFFAVNLEDIQAQDLFAQEISRCFPDSAVIGVSIPYFFTRDGVLSGSQAAVWYFGGADIRVSSVVVPLSSEQEPATNEAICRQIERQARLALHTNKDAAAFIIYRNPQSDSEITQWVKSWTQGKRFEGVPTFKLPLTDSQTDGLYFGSKRYSNALVELVVSGSIGAEIKSIDELATDDTRTNHAAFAFSGIEANIKATSDASLDLVRRSQWEKRVELLQKRLGKLTPLIVFPDVFDNNTFSDKCLILFPYPANTP